MNAPRFEPRSPDRLVQVCLALAMVSAPGQRRPRQRGGLSWRVCHRGRRTLAPARGLAVRLVPATAADLAAPPTSEAAP